MNQDKLKILIKNLELLVSSLKSEVYSDPASYRENCVGPFLNYDEVYDDDGEID
jgi:hypothetical protein